jgi:hypothetical protein
MSEMVSRIEYDKNFGKICRLLSGLIFDMPKVTPVVNASAKDGTLAPATNGKLLNMFEKWLKKSKLDEVTHADLKLFVTTAGRVESAYALLRKDAQVAGILKKIGSGRQCRYIVVAARKGKAKNKGRK